MAASPYGIVAMSAEQQWDYSCGGQLAQIKRQGK
jgi:hypothetical protein